MRWLSSQYQQGRATGEDRSWHVSATAAMLGFGESAVWTILNLFPGNSNHAFAHYTVLEGSSHSPFLAETLGEGSQTHSLLSPVTTKLFLSLTLKTCIFLLRPLPRQPAQRGLINVTSQGISFQKPNHQMPRHGNDHSSPQE